MSTPRSNKPKSTYLKITRSQYDALRQAAARWFYIEQSEAIKPPEGYASLGEYADFLSGKRIKK